MLSLQLLPRNESNKQISSGKNGLSKFADKTESSEEEEEEKKDRKSTAQHEITLENGRRFAWSAKIVDLDPKGPKNMYSAYERLFAGAEILAKNPDIRAPCVGV